MITTTTNPIETTTLDYYTHWPKTLPPFTWTYRPITNVPDINHQTKNNENSLFIIIVIIVIVIIIIISFIVCRRYRRQYAKQKLLRSMQISQQQASQSITTAPSTVSGNRYVNFSMPTTRTTTTTTATAAAAAINHEMLFRLAATTINEHSSSFMNQQRLYPDLCPNENFHTNCEPSAPPIYEYRPPVPPKPKNIF
ncbi:hypothetical protein HUG17_3893 [Dermatophagoides farinae]|uniref:Uncharacterized protein n=1 Tax=Dermatophagoides farinae TaxID=6954 RepID=A0A9D4NYL5_DERFA|nr:hypothetical protein HUG17_3893 [Dermatophagoides farinae]